MQLFKYFDLNTSDNFDFPISKIQKDNPKAMYFNMLYIF